jgi:CheY-like chemotaxis protein
MRGEQVLQGAARSRTSNFTRRHYSALILLEGYFQLANAAVGHKINLLCIMNRTILIVEDEESDVLLMRLAMKKVGVVNPIQIVSHGQEALEYLQGTGKFGSRVEFPMPSLVLLDLKLPGLSGLEVLEWLRRQPQFQSLIVIMLSSSKEPKDIQAAYRAGANAYVAKPPSVEKRLVLAQSIKDFWIAQNLPVPVA